MCNKVRRVDSDITFDDWASEVREDIPKLPDFIMGGQITHYTDRVDTLVVLIEEHDSNYGTIIAAWDDRGPVGLRLATMIYNKFKKD